MRLLILCFVLLFSLVSMAGAQTTADIALLTEPPLPEDSTFSADQRWQIRLPDSMPNNLNRPAVLAVKPPPLTLVETDDIDDGIDNSRSFNCFTCEGRSGWGGYAMGQLRYVFLDELLGVGITVKYDRVTTEGQGFMNNLPLRTTDNWLGFMLTLSFR